MGQYSDFSSQTPEVKPDSTIDPHKRDNGHLRHSYMGVPPPRPPTPQPQMSPSEKSNGNEVTWHPHV